MMIQRLFLLSGVLFFTVLNAAAEDPAPTSYIIPLSTALRSGPGGELIGNVRRSTPVTEVESKRDWVHVRVDAWVRRTELANHEVSAQVPIASAELRVSAFSITPVEKDRKSDPSKILFKLKVQNGTSQAIGSWTGTVVLEDTDGKTVFRSPVEGGNVGANALADFNFYYDESEPQYAALTNCLPNIRSLNVNLLSVKFH